MKKFFDLKDKILYQHGSKELAERWLHMDTTVLADKQGLIYKRSLRRCPWGVGNGHGDPSSNPGRDCISHSTNTLGKDMNPIILPLVVGK